MKALLTIITVAALTATVTAQSFSGALNLGISGCQVDGDTQGGYHKPGIRAGFTVSSPVDKTIAVESGLLFSSKGAVKKTQGYTEFKTKLNYVELPVIVKYHFTEKLGAELGLCYNHIISSKIIEETGAETDNPDYIRKYDIDGLAGFRYYLSPKFEIVASFEYSITKIVTDPEMPYWRNNIISLSIVRRFAFSSSKK